MMNNSCAVVYVGESYTVGVIHQHFICLETDKSKTDEIPESFLSEYENTKSALQILDLRNTYFEDGISNDPRIKYPNLSMLVFRNLNEEFLGHALRLCREAKHKGVFYIFSDGADEKRIADMLRASVIVWCEQKVKNK